MSLSPLRSAVPVALTGLFGLTLLCIVHLLATPALESSRQAAQERKLLDLLPSGSYDNRPLQHPIVLPAGGLLGNPEAEPAYLASLNDEPRAVLLSVTAKGYAGPIKFLVAINPEGQLLASKVLQQRETAGLGARIQSRHDAWLDGFSGLSLQSPATRWAMRADGGEFDQIAGATITSRAASEAQQRALRFFSEQREKLLQGAEHAR